LIEQWSGSSRAVVTSPFASGGDYLQAVTCVTHQTAGLQASPPVPTVARHSTRHSLRSGMGSHGLLSVPRMPEHMRTSCAASPVRLRQSAGRSGSTTMARSL
jgi:hypothetical protein